MSHKGSKGGAPSRKEEAETGSLRKLREGLTEISHDCFKDWDPILLKLQDKLREHTQDLQSIVQDQLRLTKVPAYKAHDPPRPSAADRRHESHIPEARSELRWQHQTLVAEREHWSTESSRTG